MTIFRVIKRIIKNPRLILIGFNRLGLFRYLSEEKVIKILWYARLGRKIDLENPRGFNEKLQWLKIFDRNPEYTIMADKARVRDIIKKRIGEKYLIPLIGVWNDPEEIDFSALPSRFVLKCNHNSGLGMCVCRDKRSLDIGSVKKSLKKGLLQKIYFEALEWPYKNIFPQIVGERFMEDTDPSNTSGTLIDYKFYCFNGEPKFLYVGTDDISSGTKGELRCSYLDLNWKEPPFSRPDHKTLSFSIEKPSNLEEMIWISKELSKNIPFVRVDLYIIDNEIYFSELTFFPGGGYGVFSPEEWENRIGDWIKLPEYKYYQSN